MIFIDTGAFLARYLARDQFHEKAREGFAEIARAGVRTFCSNFVLDETITLLGRRAGYAFAAERARLLYSSQALVILRTERQDELRALDAFDKFSDQHVSFTDCISFVLMRKNKLRKAFSFDSHYTRAGFEIFPISP